MHTYVFDVEIEQETDGRWSAVIPTLPGCATWGYSKQEAFQSLQEAAKAYLEVLLEEGNVSLQEVVKNATVLPENAIAVTV